MAPDQKKQLISGALALVAVVAIIMGLVWGGRQLWGAGIGEKCDDDFGTKPGHLCISKRAQQKCKDDLDCRPGWGCRSTEVTVSGGRGGFRFDHVKICFNPEVMADVHAREAAKALEKKRDDVRRQVIVRCIQRPPQLTDPQFDVGWRKLGDEERRSATVAALADRVITLGRGP